MYYIFQTWISQAAAGRNIKFKIEKKSSLSQLDFLQFWNRLISEKKLISFVVGKGAYFDSSDFHTSYQEFRREGWTETAIIVCKLNKSL